jgi:hypothetical protein
MCFCAGRNDKSKFLCYPWDFSASTIYIQVAPVHCLPVVYWEMDLQYKETNPMCTESVANDDENVR